VCIYYLSTITGWYITFHSVRTSHKSTRLAATPSPCRAVVAGKVQTVGWMKNVSKGGLVKLNYTENIFLAVLAFTGIKFNLTPP